MTLRTRLAVPLRSRAPVPLGASGRCSAHGVLALSRSRRSCAAAAIRCGYAALAFAGGSLIDLDHFVAAGSLNLHTIETLGEPPGHPLAAVRRAARRCSCSRSRAGRCIAWAVFAIGLSHLLFDGAGGSEPVLYPFSAARRPALAGLPARHARAVRGERRGSPARAPRARRAPAARSSRP